MHVHTMIVDLFMVCVVGSAAAIDMQVCSSSTEDQRFIRLGPISAKLLDEVDGICRCLTKIIALPDTLSLG